jgi:hypothetical protein
MCRLDRQIGAIICPPRQRPQDRRRPPKKLPDTTRMKMKDDPLEHPPGRYQNDDVAQNRRDVRSGRRIVQDLSARPKARCDDQRDDFYPLDQLPEADPTNIAYLTRETHWHMVHFHPGNLQIEQALDHDRLTVNRLAFIAVVCQDLAIFVWGQDTSRLD